jgi:hypothetical protein
VPAAATDRRTEEGQKESNAALRLVRCTIDPADAEEATINLYRNPR